MELFTNPDDAAIRAFLESARRVAVVGLSPKPFRASNGVARYLLRCGFEVVPVYPREEEILGQKVFRRLGDVPGRIDLVDVFRRREHLCGVVDDAIAAGARGVWFQLDCLDHEAARRARDAGLLAVMDRCLMVDHSRLLGRDEAPA